MSIYAVKNNFQKIGKKPLKRKIRAPYVCGCLSDGILAAFGGIIEENQN